MKIDNKGVTIVEIIVSITLISIVLIFLLRLLISLRDLDDKSLSMIKYEEKVALIVNEVQNKIRDEQECVNEDYNDSIEITCKHNSIILMNINDSIKPRIEYFINNSKTKTWTFPSGTTFDDVTYQKSSDGKFLIATMNVIDDKGHAYPIEISHYNT